MNSLHLFKPNTPDIVFGSSHDRHSNPCGSPRIAFTSFHVHSMHGRILVLFDVACGLQWRVLLKLVTVWVLLRQILRGLRNMVPRSSGWGSVFDPDNTRFGLTPPTTRASTPTRRSISPANGPRSNCLYDLHLNVDVLVMITKTGHENVRDANPNVKRKHNHCLRAGELACCPPRIRSNVSSRP